MCWVRRWRGVHSEHHNMCDGPVGAAFKGRAYVRAVEERAGHPATAGPEGCSSTCRGGRPARTMTPEELRRMGKYVAEASDCAARRSKISRACANSSPWPPLDAPRGCERASGG
jgi:hypothetical protein